MYLFNQFNKSESLTQTNFDFFTADLNVSTVLSNLALVEQITTNSKNGSSAKIVILTGYSKKMYEYRAKIMGSWGFLDKSIAPGELLQNLIEIYQGRKIFSDEVVVDILTSREIEILELVRNGLSIDDICEKVYVSKRTVSNHLANIFSKLGVSSRQEAIHVAEQLGYFSPE